jgi:hypothetical protein
LAITAFVLTTEGDVKGRSDFAEYVFFRIRRLAVAWSLATLSLSLSLSFCLPLEDGAQGEREPPIIRLSGVG